MSITLAIRRTFCAPHVAHFRPITFFAPPAFWRGCRVLFGTVYVLWSLRLFDLRGSFTRGLGARYAPTPVVIDAADGSRIKDVDGVEYMEYLLALGQLILGHRPRPVLSAVQPAVEK